MELNHLKYFYSVAKTGSFTAAAKSLRVSQPSISKIIQNLENELNEKLFERRRTGVVLSETGQMVFEKCHQIFENISSITELFDTKNVDVSGSIRFCASEAIASYHVPKVHQKVLKLFPNIHPYCNSSNTSSALQDIKNGEFEFGLFYYLPQDKEKFSVESVLKEEFFLVVHRNYQNNKTTKNSFIGSREVDYYGEKEFPILEKYQKFHPHADIRISSNSLTAHKNMVSMGLGISVLPKCMVEREISSGEFINLLSERVFFPLHLVQRENGVLSKAAKVWIEGLKSLE